MYIIFVSPEIHGQKQENSEVVPRSEGNEIKNLKQPEDQQLLDKYGRKGQS